VYLCCLQRLACPGAGSGVIHFYNILAYPLVQFILKLSPVLEGAYVLPLDNLDVVCKAVDDEHVRQLCAKLVVQFGLFAFLADAEVLWLLAGLGREEGGVVASLAHGQGDEPFFCKFKFFTVGNDDLCGDLGLDRPH